MKQTFTPPVASSSNPCALAGVAQTAPGAELVAVPRWAVLRRTAIVGKLRPEHVATLLPPEDARCPRVTAGITLLPAAFAVVDRGRPTALTRAEFVVLERLVCTPDVAVPRIELCMILGDGGLPVDDVRLRIVVHDLRKRLGDRRGARLRTVRGVGYLWRSAP